MEKERTKTPPKNASHPPHSSQPLGLGVTRIQGQVFSEGHVLNRHPIRGAYAPDGAMQFQPKNSMRMIGKDLRSSMQHVGSMYYNEDQGQRNDEESIVGGNQQHSPLNASNIRQNRLLDFPGSLAKPNVSIFDLNISPTKENDENEQNPKTQIQSEFMSRDQFQRSSVSQNLLRSEQMISRNLIADDNNPRRENEANGNGVSQNISHANVSIHANQNEASIGKGQDKNMILQKIEQFERHNLGIPDHLEASEGSNLSSPIENMVMGEVQAAQMRLNLNKAGLDEDFNLLDESVKENSMGGRNNDRKTELRKKVPEDISIDQHLLQVHKIDLEQMITKSVNFQKYVLSELSTKQLHQLRESLMVLKGQLNLAEKGIMQDQVQNMELLINESIEREEHHIQDDPLEKHDDQYSKNELFAGHEFEPQNLNSLENLENSPILFEWTPHEKFRAKLYQLDGEGRWQDQGTGYFSIEYVSNGQYKMSLLQELSNSDDLLENEVIEPFFSFHRQRETIITWQDKKREKDQAVSFQNNHGAMYTWHKICQILNIDPEKNSQESQFQDEDDPFANITYDSIQKIAEELRAAQTLDISAKHDISERFLENECGNLYKLGEIFEEIEKEHLNKVQDRGEFLFCFFCIYKGLIALNDQRLLETMVSSNFFLHTFGALEWDPEALNDKDHHFGEIEEEIFDIINDNQDIKDQVGNIDNESLHQALMNQGSSAHVLRSIKAKKLFEDDDIVNNQARSEPAEEPLHQKDENDQLEIPKSQDTVKKPEESPIKQEKQNSQKTLQATSEKKDGEVNRSQLNFREFLSKTVKFRKVIDFYCDGEPGQDLSQRAPINYENQPAESPTQGTRNEENAEPENIEEKIHINYRLQYLKDTVMARNIDDQSVNVINQIIIQNNREIVAYFFEDEEEQPQLKNNKKRRISFKDQIIQKISNTNDIHERHLAIEFMIEMCQILKSLQFSPGAIGSNNASNFIYNQNNSKAGSMYEKLNQVNFIGILSETFGIFVPNKETLLASLNKSHKAYKQEIISLYREMTQMEPQVIEDLIETKQDRNQDETQPRNPLDETTRLDSMKINSMEIIISFQQSIHLPCNFIAGFALGPEQQQKGYPFLNHLVQHLIYSPEQGLKIQISEFFKQLFEGDQNYMQQNNKEILYRQVIAKFVNFMEEQFPLLGDFKQFGETEDFNSEESKKYRLMKSLEYSVYLMLQVLNKVVQEHRFPFRQFMNTFSVIIKVAKLVFVNSELINMEIVKFYKALLRSKDTIYIQYIVTKNLFYPINKIFVDSFSERQPPMIQSCVRELYELIFSFNKNNEFYSQKLTEYLMNSDPESKNIISDPLYKSIFHKYEKFGRREDDDHFLNKNFNSEQSFDQSPRATMNPILKSKDQDYLYQGKEALKENRKDNFWEWDQKNADGFQFGDNISEDELEDIDDGQAEDDVNALQNNMNLSGHKIDILGLKGHDDVLINQGNLSPIAKNDFLSELIEHTSPRWVKNSQIENRGVTKDDHELFGFCGKESEFESKKRVKDFNKNQNQINIKLEVEQNDIQEAKEEFYNNKAFKKHIQDGNKPEEIKRNQTIFQNNLNNLKKKRQDHSANSAGKLAAIGKLQPKEERATKQVVNHKAHSSHDGFFEKLSNSSAGMIGDEDLAKDMGIFHFDKDKSREMSPNEGAGVRRNSFDELDMPTSNQKKSVLPFNPTNFMSSKQGGKVSGNSGFEGIFSSSKSEAKKIQRRSSSGDAKKTGSGEKYKDGTESPVYIQNVNLEVPTPSKSQNSEDTGKLSPSLENMPVVGSKRSINPMSGVIEGHPLGDTSVSQQTLKQQKTEDQPDNI